ncbi:MAG: DUF4870 domain-containing protein [Bacteroidetes bacterium]|nr:MAG: DUF4870 domain-containing protein [Bacteroidota bacterium]
MNETKPFNQPVDEYQAEKASNSYLMSMVAIMVGVGLPIFNLIATFIFYMANRKEAYFVRWHCTQALFSQVILFLFNAPAFVWLFTIIFRDNEFNNNFFAYIAVVLLINLIEFIATIYTAIRTRKGLHFEWIIVGPLTHSVVKNKEEVI